MSVEKYFTCSLRSLTKYFSTLEEKFRLSVQPCNILYISCLVIPQGIRNEVRISEPTNQRGLFLENSHLNQAKSHKIYGPIYILHLCQASMYFSFLLSTTNPKNVNMIETTGFPSFIGLFRFTIILFSRYPQIAKASLGGQCLYN